MATRLLIKLWLDNETDTIDLCATSAVAPSGDALDFTKAVRSKMRTHEKPSFDVNSNDIPGANFDRQSV